MATETVFSIRRDNLRQLVMSKPYDGNRSAFSRATEVHVNQINLFLTDNPNHRRNLGEALARKIEAKLGLSEGWFDVVHGGEGAPLKISSPRGELPAALVGLFARDAAVASLEVHASFLSSFGGKITSPDNILVAAVATRDIPELTPGDTVFIDAGVKAITADGVYILQRGDTTVLRRISKQMSGTWLVHGAGGAPAETLDNLRNVKACGRVLMVWRHSLV
jgi:hypothetical protein